jgi:hypothetical protein
VSVFADGVALFNQGAYFEAHEAFEERLDEAEADDRWAVLVALIQVAVGYHKAQAGHPGAERMLGLGLAKLAPFPTTAWGLDLGTFRQQVTDDLRAAEAGAPLADRIIASPPRIMMSAA